MYPDLLTIGPYTLHSYGVLLFVGVVAGILVVRALASRSHIDPDRMTELSIALAFVGYLGAYLLYVLTRLWTDGSSPAVAWRAAQNGALSWYGAVLSSLPFAWWYLRRYGIPAWRGLDAVVPGVALGQAIGRMGCLLGGCCYGKPTDSWLGVRFDSASVAAGYRGLPLHPTQLYEALGLLVLFVFLLRLFRSRTFDGQILLVYLMAYSALKFVVEVFRGDTARGFAIEGLVSLNQLIALCMVLVSATLFFLLRGRRSC